MNVMPKGAIAGLLVMTAAAAAAQTSSELFPVKPVRIITGGAGIFHDTVTRQLGKRLSERWGQPVVVENQPAAALTIGTGIAARATPDGYTLVMSDRSALAVAPHLYKKIGYDPVRDFAPITLAALTPTMLVAHPSLAANTLPEFLSYARQQPQPVQFATAGPGTNPHIALELLKQATGVNASAIHYKGGGGSSQAILSGEVKIGFGAVSTVLPHVAAGKLKAYAVSGKQRFAGAPDVPTAAETGFPGFELEFWIGVLAPARTPSALVARLNRDIGLALREPALKATLLAQGASAAPGTPDEFAAFIAAEGERWGALARRAGAVAE